MKNKIAVCYNIFQTGVLDFCHKPRDYCEYIGLQSKNNVVALLKGARHHPESWALVKFWRVRWLQDGADVALPTTVQTFPRLFDINFDIEGVLVNES